MTSERVRPAILSAVGFLFLFTLGIFLSGESTPRPALRKTVRSAAQAPVLSKELQIILGKVAAYCARLKDISLFYVCRETVHETIYDPFRVPGAKQEWRVASHSCSYDYQLIRREDVRETRVLLRRDGVAENRPNAPLDTSRFSYKTVIFGPIGIFGAVAQPFHVYSIVRTAKLWGRPVTVVSAVPHAESAAWLYGEAWIDNETGAILRIDWEEGTLENYEALAAFARSIKARPALKHFSEYRFVRNGIRFPSRFEIREEYVRPWISPRPIVKSELRVTYSGYKYFTVETEVRNAPARRRKPSAGAVPIS